jgi:hypothetical protein
MTQSNQITEPLAIGEFLDKLSIALSVKNDAALCRQLRVVAPVVSKWRHGRLKFGGLAAIRAHKLTGWPIEQIERDLGVVF